MKPSRCSYCLPPAGRSSGTRQVTPVLSLWLPSCPQLRRLPSYERFGQRLVRYHHRLLSTQTDFGHDNYYPISPYNRTNLLFGANTDVGKTIVAAGLIRASVVAATVSDAGAASSPRLTTHYIKPLQCGGSDQAFVEKYANPATFNTSTPSATNRHEQLLTTQTLFRWNTPLSPHIASILEDQPCSDEQILSALRVSLSEIAQEAGTTTVPATSTTAAAAVTYIETAGGVLSPASSSPDNKQPRHAQTRSFAHTSQNSNNADTVPTTTTSWGWTLQADLYQPLIGVAPVVLVGDGRLGGISCTIAALESLILRGYDVAAIVVIGNGKTEQGDNAVALDPNRRPTSHTPDTVAALRDYVSTRRFPLRSGSSEVLLSSHPMQSIVSLPPIPSDVAIPLFEWYKSDQVSHTFTKLNQYLQHCWEGQVADLSSLVRTTDASSAVWWPDSLSIDATATSRRVWVDSAVGNHLQIVRDEVAASIPTGQDNGTMNSKFANNGTMNSKFATSRLMGRSVLDATAASWTRGIGHGESSLALATAAAAGRYGATTAALAVHHAPAVALAQALLSLSGPGGGGGAASWAQRVFYTDDGGSVAVEAAIQMGLGLYQARMKLSQDEIEATDWILCTQEDCYHGDTLGAKLVAEEYTDRTHPWYQAKSLFLATPTIGYRNGVLAISFPEGMQPPDDIARSFASVSHIMDVTARSVVTKLKSLYKEFIEMQWLVHEHRSQQKIGAVLLEPILQCVGGMKFIDPLWQRAMMEVAESRNIPVIFDESTVGLYRLGVASCRSIIIRDPDIAVYSKLLTSGLVPLSVTLTSEEVWNAFHSTNTGIPQQRLLNGNTYVANPVACVAALHSLAAYDMCLQSKSTGEERVGSPSTVNVVQQLWFDERYCQDISKLACVEQSFTLGTVLSVELIAEMDNAVTPRVDLVVGALWDHGVKADAIGNVVYLMVSPLTDRIECSEMAKRLYEVVSGLN